jgi:hypothetical protein
MRISILVAFLGAVFVTCCSLQAGEKKLEPKKAEKSAPAKPAPVKMIAGKSELLREVPKKFASYLGIDCKSGKVRLHLEGDKEPTAWDLKPDVEIKVLGFWGRLEHLRASERVWVWFDIDRARKPRAILMLADEISEQHIHQTPPILTALDVKQGSITLSDSLSLATAKRGPGRTLKLSGGRHIAESGAGLAWSDDAKVVAQRLGALTLAKPVYVQSTGDTFQIALDEPTLEKVRSSQRLRMRDIWEKEGLPGSVVFLHPLGGEMDYMLDHEAMRWGRSLKTGDLVKLNAPNPVKAQVKEVRPWRERTLVRLVTGGFDQADLHLGQRVTLSMAKPPLEVDTAELPPDVDRPRLRDERIEWVLASVYCACQVAGDRCTGMFYTLASCNVNACGMPRHVRRLVAEMIDQGLTDRQILASLRKEQGPQLFQPHLLP